MNAHIVAPVIQVLIWVCVNKFVDHFTVSLLGWLQWCWFGWNAAVRNSRKDCINVSCSHNQPLGACYYTHVPANFVRVYSFSQSVFKCNSVPSTSLTYWCLRSLSSFCIVLFFLTRDTLPSAITRNTEMSVWDKFGVTLNDSVLYVFFFGCVLDTSIRSTDVDGHATVWLRIFILKTMQGSR